MNILHAILSDGFFGSERYCIELAVAQAKAGHRVGLLIQNRNSAAGRAFRREADAANDAIAREGTPGRIFLFVIPSAIPKLLHRAFASWTARKFAPHIVHTHLNPAARRAGRVAQRLGIPHVATLHIRYDAREHGACDGLICNAEWQRARLPPEFSGGVVVVWPWLPQGVHNAWSRVTPAEIAALRRTWSAGESTRVFGSIGRLAPEKGMDVLMRAFSRAFPQGHEDVRLVIVGDGPQADELRRLGRGDARIMVSATQSEIAPFYGAFDVYVSAARFEPFGLTILEAMDAGCPLIVTRTEGPREFVKDPSAAWSDPNDEDSLAAALSALARRGRARIDYDMSLFRVERAASAIESFYRQVRSVKRNFH